MKKIISGRASYCVILSIVLVGIALLVVVIGNNSKCIGHPIIVYKYLMATPPGQWYVCRKNHEGIRLVTDMGIISPSETWMAQIFYAGSHTAQELQIRKNGHPESEVAIPWEDEWVDSLYYVHWVDDQRLLFHRVDREHRTEKGVVILNPWTDERWVIEPELPYSDEYVISHTY